jgi:hypothetical protein
MTPLATSTVPSDVPGGGRDGRRLIGGGLLLRRTPGTFTPLYAGMRLRAPAPGRQAVTVEGWAAGRAAGTVEGRAPRRPFATVNKADR